MASQTARAASSSKSEGGAGPSGSSAAAQSGSTEPQDHPFASFLDPFLKTTEMQWSGARNINAMSQSFAASMHGAMQLYGEATRFMSQRMQEDMKTIGKLTSCRNGEDLFRVGADFFDTTLREYADEASRIAHLAADAAQDSLKPLEDRTKEALHSIAAIPDKNGHFV